MASFGASKGVWLAIGGSLVGILACGTTTPSAEVRSDGRLRVTPAEFTAELGCSFASGEESGLGYYVATIVDLGPAPDDDTSGGTVDAAGYPKISGNGPIARCTSSTSFSTATDDSLITFGHLYVSIIDAYPPGDTPVLRGERSDGWPAPSWQWLCGVGGLDHSELRWLVDQINELPRNSAPTPAPDAGSSASEDPAASADAGATDAGSGPDSGASTSDAGNTSREFDTGQASSPDTGTSKGTTWDELLEAAALEAFPTPARVVAGAQAGIRGCILID